MLYNFPNGTAFTMQVCLKNDFKNYYKIRLKFYKAIYTAHRFCTLRDMKPRLIILRLEVRVNQGI